jgi:hypothetical protein
MDTDAPELNHESTNTNDDTTFSSSNVDTMPHTDPHTQGQRRRGIDHGSTLIDMLDALNRPDDASGSSTSSQAHPLNPNTGRRYTAAEKGKGRAPANATTEGRAISISDTDDEGGDESIEVTGVKRKADVLEQSVSGDDEEEDIEVIANEEEGWLGAYSESKRGRWRKKAYISLSCLFFRTYKCCRYCLVSLLYSGSSRVFPSLLLQARSVSSSRCGAHSLKPFYSLHTSATSSLLLDHLSPDTPMCLLTPSHG